MRNNKKLITFVLTLLIIIFIASSIGLISYASSATDIQNYRSQLWKGGAKSTQSNSEIMTFNALVKYIKAGVWDTYNDDSLKCDSSKTYKTMDDIQTSCQPAYAFYVNASTYANIVTARMAKNDPGGTKLTKAMDRISDLSGDVIKLFLGFGLLSSFLVFAIMSMRIAWMPSHAMQRRVVMVDILTSGVATIILGNIWIVISLFQSSFNRFWQTYAVYSKDWRSVAYMVLMEYKGFITGLVGIATLVVLAMFIVNFASVAIDAGNASKRTEKMQNIVNCAVASAMLGSITIIVGFFWTMFS